MWKGSLKVFPVVVLLFICTGLSGESKEQADLVDALFGNPSFLEAKLSPTGRYLASLTHYHGRRSLLVLDLETSQHSGVTVQPGEDIDHFYWIDAEKVIYHVSKWEVYTEGLSVYSVKLKRAHKVLTPGMNGMIYKGMVDPLVHIPDEFVFQASQSDATNPAHLYKMNVVSQSVNRLAKNNGEIHSYVVGKDARPLFALDIRSGNLTVLKFGQDKKWIPADSIPGSITPLGLLPGDRYMLASVRNNQGFSGVNLLDLDTGRLVQETRFYPGYDLVCSSSRPIVDNLNGYTVGVYFQHDKPDNFWFSDSLKKVEQFVERNLPHHTIEFLGYRAESGCIYYTISSDIHPPFILQLNMETLEFKVVYRQFPKAGGIEFQPMRPVSFTHSGFNGKIHGYLTLPKGVGPFPTVLLIHGGPQLRDRWGFNPQVQFLALNGYAVFQINYRGSVGYGRRFGLKGFGMIADKSVEDVIEGAKWLVREGIADPARIAIMGGSFGGYVSTAAATREPGLWNAVISFGGLYDLERLHKRDQRMGYNWVDDLFTDYDQQLYTELSPIHHAGKVSAPVLLVHGKADQRVNARQARKMESALEKAGKEVETMYISWGVHGLPEEKDRRKFYLRILSFLEKHMQ